MGIVPFRKTTRVREDARPTHTDHIKIWERAWVKFLIVCLRASNNEFNADIEFIGFNYSNATLVIKSNNDFDWNIINNLQQVLLEQFNLSARYLNIKAYAIFLWIMPEDIDEIKTTSLGTIVLPYRFRIDKSVNAISYLKALYWQELESDAITLSELKGLDQDLWRALRNWAYNGRHNLDSIIPRGENKGGRPALTPAVDPETLDPSDPRDALALQLLRHRKAARENARRKRAVAKSGVS